MKKRIWISFLICFFIYGFSSHADSINQLNDWDDEWIVETAQAEAMIGYINCSTSKCKKPKHFNYDQSLVRRISDKYKPISWQWIPARYRDEDAERYRRARKIPDSNQKGNVSGYETKLLKIIYVNDNGMDIGNSTVYFDIGNICPPPDDCS